MYGRRVQVAVAVIPLFAVISASLIWSGYATFHHAQGPQVPASIAWTLILALDGTVVVTTPIWLSTILPGRVRNYAALICMAALGGSMAINYSETGWPGVFPPLIAGALIHLVGVVLRSFARMDKEASKSVDTSNEVESKDQVQVENTETPIVAVEEKHEFLPALPKGVDLVKSSVPTPVIASARPLASVKLPGEVLSPQEIVFGLLDAAVAAENAEPSGPELTNAVREAGHDVNSEYGRTAKARWKKARERVSA